MDERALRNQMCEVGERLWERGLIGASEGNLSARLPNGNILCTPSGGSKGHIKADELVVLAFPTDRSRSDSGSTARSELRALHKGAKPSSEIKLHLRVYEKRPDCGAVVHAHPPTATAFALANRAIPDGILPEAAAVLGPVALVPFGFPGTDEVPDGLEPFLKGHKTFLLSQHGAVTLGKGLWDAFERMETLERIARIVLEAEMLGGATPLPDGVLERLYQKWPPSQL